MHKIGSGLVLLSLFASSAFADPPPSDHIVIDIITVNGSGCPAGTAAIAVSPDNTAFTVSFSNYMAQIGVGSVPTDFRKNCQLNILVHVPSGFTYAIASANYRGFASIASGANFVSRANYFFQGQTPTGQISHTFPGPMLDDWQTTDVTEVASLVFSPCGALRNLNINTELRVIAGTSDVTKTTSFATMDSADGQITTQYNFQWKRCT
jgi:hypothetical protein